MKPLRIPPVAVLMLANNGFVFDEHEAPEHFEARLRVFLEENPFPTNTRVQDCIRAQRGPEPSEEVAALMLEIKNEEV